MWAPISDDYRGLGRSCAHPLSRLGHGRQDAGALFWPEPQELDAQPLAKHVEKRAPVPVWLIACMLAAAVLEKQRNPDVERRGRRVSRKSNLLQDTIQDRKARVDRAGQLIGVNQVRELGRLLPR